VLPPLLLVKESWPKNSKYLILRGEDFKFELKTGQDYFIDHIILTM
jgi:hypothetical protein